MKEYGGYIELESFHGSLLHDQALKLNCGRNALAYIGEAKKIKKLYLPYFLCSSVSLLCDKMGITYEYYHIGVDFTPIFSKTLGPDEWLYIVNFYGQLSNACLEQWKSKYDRVIVDNAQSYYQMPVHGVDTIYTCRKYFGVPDGAFLYTDAYLDRKLSRDISFERMHFLLGRYERGANPFYSEYVANNRLFATEPVKIMSYLTENLLRGIDYEAVKQRRNHNFSYLSQALESINKLQLKAVDGPFMYPLLVSNGFAIRKILQSKKIYIPTLWPNVLEDCSSESLEYRYAADILPIPIDQRYGEEDMKYLVEVIKNVLFERA